MVSQETPAKIKNRVNTNRIVFLSLAVLVGIFGIAGKNLAIAILPVIGVGLWLVFINLTSKADARFENGKLIITDEIGQIEIGRDVIERIEAHHAPKMATYTIYFKAPIHEKESVTFNDPEYEASFFPSKFVFSDNLFPSLNKMIELGLYEPKRGEPGFSYFTSSQRKA